MRLKELLKCSAADLLSPVRVRGEETRPPLLGLDQLCHASLYYYNTQNLIETQMNAILSVYRLKNKGRDVLLSLCGGQRSGLLKFMLCAG